MVHASGVINHFNDGGHFGTPDKLPSCLCDYMHHWQVTKQVSLCQSYASVSRDCRFKGAYSLFKTGLIKVSTARRDGTTTSLLGLAQDIQEAVTKAVCLLLRVQSDAVRHNIRNAMRVGLGLTFSRILPDDVAHRWGGVFRNCIHLVRLLSPEDSKLICGSRYKARWRKLSINTCSLPPASCSLTDRHALIQPPIKRKTSEEHSKSPIFDKLSMHHLALLSILLAPLAAAAPSAVGLHARDGEVTIYSNIIYRGQSQRIPTNGICVNLRAPLYVYI